MVLIVTAQMNMLRVYLCKFTFGKQLFCQMGTLRTCGVHGAPGDRGAPGVQS